MPPIRCPRCENLHGGGETVCLICGQDLSKVSTIQTPPKIVSKKEGLQAARAVGAQTKPGAAAVAGVPEKDPAKRKSIVFIRWVVFILNIIFGTSILEASAGLPDASLRTAIFVFQCIALALLLFDRFDPFLKKGTRIFLWISFAAASLLVLASASGA